MPTHSSLSLILNETGAVELLLLDGPTFQEFQIVNELLNPNFTRKRKKEPLHFDGFVCNRITLFDCYISL